MLAVTSVCLSAKNVGTSTVKIIFFSVTQISGSIWARDTTVGLNGVVLMEYFGTHIFHLNR